MSRLLNVSGVGFLYLAASLFLAQLLLGAYLAYAWRIDKDKVNLMLAVAQGFDLYESELKLREAVEDKIVQMSYDEILAMRAKRGIQEDLEKTRESNTKDIILADVRRFEEQRNDFNEIILNSRKYLTDLEKEAQSQGFQDLVANMEALAPPLAKAQIMKMYDDEQHDRIVMLLRSMNERSRKKLLNVLTEEEDIEKLADILKRIGDGEPESRISRESLDTLDAF